MNIYHTKILLLPKLTFAKKATKNLKWNSWWVDGELEAAFVDYSVGFEVHFVDFKSARGVKKSSEEEEGKIAQHSSRVKH